MKFKSLFPDAKLYVEFEVKHCFVCVIIEGKTVGLRECMDFVLSVVGSYVQGTTSQAKQVIGWLLGDHIKIVSMKKKKKKKKHS